MVPSQEVGSHVITIDRTGAGHEVEFGRMANGTLTWTGCFHQTMAFTAVTPVHGHYHRCRRLLGIVTIGARKASVRCVSEDERCRPLFHGSLQILVAAPAHLQIQGKALLMMAIRTELHLMADETVGFVLFSRRPMLPDEEDGVRHGRLMALGAELIIVTVVTLCSYIEQREFAMSFAPIGGLVGGGKSLSLDVTIDTEGLSVAGITMPHILFGFSNMLSREETFLFVISGLQIELGWVTLTTFVGSEHTLGPVTEAVAVVADVHRGTVGNPFFMNLPDVASFTPILPLEVNGMIEDQAVSLQPLGDFVEHPMTFGALRHGDRGLPALLASSKSIENTAHQKYNESKTKNI